MVLAGYYINAMRDRNAAKTSQNLGRWVTETCSVLYGRCREASLQRNAGFRILCSPSSVWSVITRNAQAIMQNIQDSVRACLISRASFPRSCTHTVHYNHGSDSAARKPRRTPCPRLLRLDCSPTCTPTWLLTSLANMLCKQAKMRESWPWCHDEGRPGSICPLSFAGCVWNASSQELNS